MQQIWHHTRHKRAPSDPASAFGDEGAQAVGGFSPPVPYDRPFTPANVVQTSPVTNSKLDNDQEMQSGADNMSGVHDSRVSGGDYSREQGVGRAPGFRWPWNQRSEAWNVQSLDRWMIERSEAGVTLPVHTPAGGLTLALNPYDAPYRDITPSPIAAMDQETTYYENDPDQWWYFAPPPMSIPDERAPNFTEQAVLY
jgi:hypothetical protein